MPGPDPSPSVRAPAVSPGALLVFLALALTPAGPAACRPTPPAGPDASSRATIVARATAPPATPTPSSTATPSFPADAVVSVASLNLRSGPGTLHPIVDVLATGTAVALRGRSHDDRWLAVLSPDLQEGWLSARHVRLARDLTGIPTLVTPTSPPTRTATPQPADPAQTLVLAPPAVAQGDPLLVRLRSPGSVQVVASLAETTTRLFRFGDEALAGLLPVPIDLPPGEHVVHVTVVDAAGDPVDHTASLLVHPAPPATETISLDETASALLDPALRAAEADLLAERVWNLEPTERHWLGAWQRPVTVSVSSPFGSLRAYNDGPAGDRHTGLDLRGPVGWPIVAPAAGGVVLAEALAIRGNTVWLDHGWGVHSGYFHLDAIAVGVGQDVTAGQVLGTLGRTGRATGPHLHWEIRVAGVPVQPIEFLLRDVGAVP